MFFTHVCLAGTGRISPVLFPSDSESEEKDQGTDSQDDNSGSEVEGSSQGGSDSSSDSDDEPGSDQEQVGEHADDEEEGPSTIPTAGKRFGNISHICTN